MKKVIVLTTMWDTLHREAQERAEAHHAQLRDQDRFFKTMVSGGAGMMKHYNNKASAVNAVSYLLPRTPTAILIQQEMADGRALASTEAGEIVNERLIEIQEGYKKDMQDLREEMEAANRKSELCRCSS